MEEAADVDETQIDGKKKGTGDQPHDNQWQLRLSDRNREEDEIDHCGRNGSKRFIDGVVDTCQARTFVFSGS